jgi:IS30 family transposase
MVKPRNYINDALKIGDRPAHIATREEGGHWEGDLIMGKANKSAIVTLVERSSRFLIAFALPAGSRSEVMRDQLIGTFGVLPATLRRTLTWDRGSEMARHAEVTAALGTLVYFCDPASPWQRASNENANGLLRQYFRKGADLSAVEHAEVCLAADEINWRPRAVLEWDSATDRFASLQAVAAFQDKAVSAAIEVAVPLPTTGDNLHELSTATAARELPQWLPIPAVDNSN